MKYEVSMIILEQLFNFSSLIVSGRDKAEALKDAINEMIDRLQGMTDAEIQTIAENNDDLIYEPIVMQIRRNNERLNTKVKELGQKFNFE